MNRPAPVRAMRTAVFLLLTLPALAGCLTDSGLGGVAESATSGKGDATVADPPTWGPEDAPIRPGASLGGYCTFNFLWYDAQTGTPYIGTAGHCTDEIGEVVELPGYGTVGQVVFDSDLTDAFPGVDPTVDFSLIELQTEADANPRMLGHDGPTGAVTLDDLAVGDTIELHGYGLVLGQNDVTRDRFGFLVDWDEQQYRVDMPAVNGDSGSPLLHGPSGKAFGIVSHYGLGAVPPSTDEGPHMPFLYEQLAAAGFPDVVLATI